MGDTRDVFAGRPEDRNAACRGEREDTTGVVCMMVGDEYRREAQAVSVNIVLHHGCVAWIDHRNVLPRAQGPDVVVVECR